VWLVVALVLGVAVRVFFFQTPMIHDEGGYALAARGWFEGTGQIYDDLWISRPQGIFVIYGITMKTIGYGVAAFRAMAWIFATLTVLAVWLFGRRWTTPGTALTAVFVTTLLLGAPTLEGYTANAEIFAGMPAAFSAFWMLRQAQTGYTRKGLIGIGLLIGISTLLKPSAVTMWPALALFLMLTTNDSYRDRVKRAGWLTLGLAIAGGIALLHGATLGFGDFFYATILYRYRQQSAISVGLLYNIRAMGGLLYNATEFFLLIILVWIFRLRLPLVPVLNQPPKSDGPLWWLPEWLRKLRTNDPGGLILVLWIVASAVGVFMGGDYWTHYLVLVVPPVALWLARAVDGIRHALHGWRQQLAMLMFALLLILPYGVALDGTDSLYQRLYRHPGYPAQNEVARYIRGNTSPDQTIYVAFDQASIYYLADRKPAYRHLYDQELRALPHSYTDIIGILSSDNRPVYIISTLHPGPFPDDSRAFWREVSRFYDLETMIHGVPIYRVKPGLRHSGDDATTGAKSDLRLQDLQIHRAVCDFRPPRPGFPSARAEGKPLAQ
jgi:4-amino-4-deoxy-L-arabinose transferase-like glycosyltransferase